MQTFRSRYLKRILGAADTEKQQQEQQEDEQERQTLRSRLLKYLSNREGNDD